VWQPDAPTTTVQPLESVFMHPPASFLSVRPRPVCKLNFRARSLHNCAGIFTISYTASQSIAQSANTHHGPPHIHLNSNFARHSRTFLTLKGSQWSAVSLLREGESPFSLIAARNCTICRSYITGCRTFSLNPTKANLL
jgi:hypothetical protein